MARWCSPPSTSAYGPRSSPGRSKKASAVAVADVEEEVRRARVGRGSRTCRSAGTRAGPGRSDGRLDVVRDQRDVVHAAAGGRRAVLPGERVLRPDAVARGREACRWSSLISDALSAGVGVLFGVIVDSPSQAAARVACISQTRISAARSAVTRWPPVAVNRTASPSASAPGALQLDLAPRRRTGAGTAPRAARRVSPGASRAACSAAWRFVIRMAAASSCLAMPEATGTSPPRQQLVVDLAAARSRARCRPRRARPTSARSAPGRCGVAALAAARSRSSPSAGSRCRRSSAAPGPGR